MTDYTTLLPRHTEKFVGEHDLFLEVFDNAESKTATQRPPLLLVHGAYTGSWMWSKYIPRFLAEGWACYAMNLRSHYKSRSMDMTQITFEDYLDDLKEIIPECGRPPVVMGFSLGGILCQKLAETERFAGIVLIDSAVSREVNEAVPYASPSEGILDIVDPAPVREERSTIDESENDIEFQKKYNSMESTKVFNSMGCWRKGVKGIPVDSQKVTCPALVIKSVSSEEDDRRGRAQAEQFSAEYAGFAGMSHTGLLIGTRYNEPVEKIIGWLSRNAGK